MPRERRSESLKTIKNVGSDFRGQDKQTVPGRELSPHAPVFLTPPRLRAARVPARPQRRMPSRWHRERPFTKAGHAGRAAERASFCRVPGRGLSAASMRKPVRPPALHKSAGEEQSFPL